MLFRPACVHTSFIRGRSLFASLAAHGASSQRERTHVHMRVPQSSHRQKDRALGSRCRSHLRRRARRDLCELHGHPGDNRVERVCDRHPLNRTRSGSGAIFNVSGAKIGQEATGSLTITNTGTISGVFTGTRLFDRRARLEHQARDLHATTDNVAGSNSTTERSRAVRSARPRHRSRPAGFDHVLLPRSLPTTGTDAGDNLLQGSSASTTFSWTADQA